LVNENKDQAGREKVKILNWSNIEDVSRMKLIYEEIGRMGKIFEWKGL